MLGSILITTVLGTAGVSSAATLQDTQSHVDQIAALAQGSPTLAVSAGYFLMGTARTSDGSFSLAAQYDDTEQPQPLRSPSYGRECRRVGQRLVWDRLLRDDAGA